MKKYITITLIGLLQSCEPVLAGEHIPFRDTCSIVRAWQEQPAVPLPTFDHHLGKITAAIGLYSVLSLSGVNRTRSLLITSGAALTFEMVQVIFFDETIGHSINDMVLFSFHIPVHFMLQRKYFVGAVVTVNLVGVYLLLLPCQ
jgi:hypothetical protein